MSGRPAVFLDRDGVLNAVRVVGGVPHPPTGPNDFIVLEGVVAACASLREGGFALVVVTNQPDLARKTLDSATLSAIHARLTSEVELDAIYVCPHDDRDGCKCRKPAPGMLFDAARDCGLDLGRSVLVGDRWRDIAAGRRAGCRTVLVDHGYDEPLAHGADLVVDSLASATSWVLATLGTQRETGND